MYTSPKLSQKKLQEASLNLFKTASGGVLRGSTNNSKSMISPRFATGNRAFLAVFIGCFKWLIKHGYPLRVVVKP